jgi:hypothetical protein
MIDPKTIVIEKSGEEEKRIGTIDPEVHNPEILNLRESCTKEEAVAMMLGWMQGCVRPKYVQLNEDGIPADQLLVMHSLDGSLQNHLADLRAAAYQEFIDADNECASAEVLDEKNQAIINCDALSKKAWDYLMDIADEIAKKDSSELRPDDAATERTGVTHYTLRSVEKWAKETHNISIFGTSETFPLASIGAEPQQENETVRKGGLSKTVAENLYTTFAFLVEELSKEGGRFLKQGVDINVTNIAKHLEKLATEANGGEKLGAQDHEAIKGRIENAVKIKRSKLPKNAK